MRNQHLPYPRRRKIDIWLIAREVIFGSVFIYGLIAVIYFVGGWVE